MSRCAVVPTPTSKRPPVRLVESWHEAPKSIQDPVLNQLAHRAFRSLSLAEDYLTDLTSDKCTMDEARAKRSARLCRSNHQRARAFYGAWRVLCPGHYMPMFEEREQPLFKMWSRP